MSRFLHRSLFTDPVTAVRGEGIYLYTADGKQIIDGSGGALYMRDGVLHVIDIR